MFGSHLFMGGLGSTLMRLLTLSLVKGGYAAVVRNHDGLVMASVGLLWCLP